MGSVGEAPAPTANSAMTDVNVHDLIGDGGAVGEPLVQDDEQVLAHGVGHLQEPPRTPVKSSQYHPLGSHPIVSEPEEEEAAPPPPDFTRRGIHIPMRTR